MQTSNLEAGAEITLEEAARWTTKFRKLHSQEPQAMYFDQSVYITLLEQNGVDGIRIYNAINEDNKQVLVLAGVTDSGDVLGKVFDKGGGSIVLVGVNSTGDRTSGKIFDRGIRCPP